MSIRTYNLKVEWLLEAIDRDCSEKLVQFMRDEVQIDFESLSDDMQQAIRISCNAEILETIG